MISSGGPGKTKFPSIIFLGENPKKNSTIKLTFSAAPHPLAPIPTRYTPSPKYVQRRVRSFFYDIIEGGPERLNFRPSYFYGENPKKKLDNQIGFQAVFHPPAPILT
jgi:hypothetical protein